MELEYSDPNLSAVWLLATLDERRKRGRRGKTGEIDIKKTCESIIRVSGTIPLRRTSNLMYGTVLAYKRQCISDWNEASSCRMLIQRLGGMRGKVVREKMEEVVLLKDDPKFDISQGLVEEWEEPQREREEVEEEEEELVVPDVFTQEKWDDVGFQFDANGDVMYDEPVEEVDVGVVDVHFDEPFEFGILEDPIIEDAIAQEAEEEQPVVEEVPVRKINKKTRAKKLIIDESVMMSSETIMKIRDGYIGQERDKMARAYKKVEVRGIEVMIGDMVDIEKYRGMFGGNEREDVNYDEMMDYDIEYGRIGGSSRGISREEMRSRSSSVSSVEQGRRARHSSSFHFDFADEAGKEVDYAVEEGDIAQLDISIDRYNGEEFVASVEKSCGEKSFEMLVAGNNRGEVVYKFMKLLELGSLGRVSLSQERLFSDILIK